MSVNNMKTGTRYGPAKESIDRQAAIISDAATLSTKELSVKYELSVSRIQAIIRVAKLRALHQPTGTTYQETPKP